jgi:hypothetical protein
LGGGRSKKKRREKEREREREREGGHFIFKGHENSGDPPAISPGGHLAVFAMFT